MPFHKIDRIDDHGDIREHLVEEDGRTICGLPLRGRMTQKPCGNRECGRCDRIARVRLSKTGLAQ